jgi:putative hydrolase of the HAD superfamily
MARRSCRPPRARASAGSRLRDRPVPEDANLHQVMNERYSRAMERDIRAVLWDFGGVITASPFEALNRYEAAHGIPRDFIRRVNSIDPHANAWARMERGELALETFGEAFRVESAALGHAIDGRELLPLLAGEIRPRMVVALRLVKAKYRIACLTNNIRVGHGPAMSGSPGRAMALREVLDLFEIVLESSRVGVRKPEPAFYERACAMLGVVPAECVLLDDLGINLKPAALMGMRTIKVVDPERALAELGEVLGMNLL